MSLSLTAICAGCGAAELEKFVQNLDRGMAEDSRYVEFNRLALDNICKKFDKRRNMLGGAQLAPQSSLLIVVQKTLKMPLLTSVH